MKGTALNGATKRVHGGETRAHGRSVTRAQWTVARPSRRLHRVSRTRIFGESQSSPTTTKKRTTGPPMTPPKDPNEGGGGGGGWGGNIARNVALNLGFLGLWMFLDSTGGGGGFFQGGGNFGGGGGGGDGGGGGGGGGGSGGGPSEPTFKIREIGDSDDEVERLCGCLCLRGLLLGFAAEEGQKKNKRAKAATKEEIISGLMKWIEWRKFDDEWF